MSVISIADLFNKYKTDVFRFSLSFVRDTHTAEDITGEVFLALIQSQDKIRDLSKIKSWLLTTAKNLSLNALKNQGKETQIPEDLPENTESDLEFFALLECLCEEDRQIVTLYIVTRLKHHEIAKIVGLSPGTVRQRYSRALKTIKENLS